MEEVRHQFRETLRELEAGTLGGLDMVVQQVDRALEALSYQDVELAGMVVADDDRIDGRYLEVHQGILSLLARQAPVAGDLRKVTGWLPPDPARKLIGRAVRALCARNCRVTWCVHYNMDRARPAQLSRFLRRIRAAARALN